jgi:transcriptional regulator with XRE-family HTH domain
MQHEEYIEEQMDADPRFGTRLAVAQACLNFSETIEWERSQRRISAEQLAQETGLTEDRIAAIEEGETPSLEEVLLLSSVLHLDIVFDHRTGMKVLGTAGNEATLTQHSG